MPKRKNSKSKKSSNILLYTAWSLAIVAAMLVALVGGYYIGYEHAKKDISSKDQSKEKKRLSMLKKLEEASLKKEKDVSDRLKDVLKKRNTETLTDGEKASSLIGAAHEYDISTLPKAPKRDIKITSSKPKLAIILDDVSVKSHVNAIKSLNLPITMSFLPPSEFRPNSHILAAKENFYMVHLPMEAENFTKEEPFTLRIKDSQKEISQRIEKIKKLFPKVQYINNHTGSKFTSDELAVNKLIYALQKQHINFIDSRTIATTKVPAVMKNYGMKYMARDVFIDHEMDKAYIKSQIKKAVKIAKAHGSAIAIGHPHANTIMALSESKKLFKDVELVLVNRLY
ncbi:divergent polysaccharide deacetylase family protein [Sulfurimonas sp.]|uniref:divergent polysaccharide deacetylase family protein n=1 Tax=Sulfurimonas sp. TaxID=2022749 RepID=UPI00263664CC|nr:divergent polysaccharide deacetylase family protein [Sulfurimonas sp.]MCW8895868.1 divergent polysaccharide deacetylase family protein [Sulfurimonas sp.]